MSNLTQTSQTLRKYELYDVGAVRQLMSAGSNAGGYFSASAMQGRGRFVILIRSRLHAVSRTVLDLIGYWISYHDESSNPMSNP